MYPAGRGYGGRGDGRHGYGGRGDGRHGYGGRGAGRNSVFMPSTSSVASATSNSDFESPNEPMEESINEHMEEHQQIVGGNPDALDRLDPNGLWFDNDHKVASRVTESIKTFYNGPWTSFSNLPACAPTIWFRNFRHYYRWDPLISQEVKNAFVAEAIKSLRQLASRLGMEADESKTIWCPSDVRQKLLEYKETSKFQEKSTKCSKSRTVGERARTTHAQGSISAKKLKEVMTKELKREVSAAELFQRGHFSKEKKKFVDKQADKVWEKYEMIKRDNNNQDATDNDFFYEAAGGWDAKGRLYGLGCAGELYYVKSKGSDSSKRQRTTYVDLRKRVEDQQQQIEQLRAIVEKLTQNMTPCRPQTTASSLPRSPAPPSGGSRHGHGIAA
ncbi:uncharacterized protein [Spinacia oleracea]|nr:uncharacterized protein LOC110798050 isoform X2 [Spinacia oleracea]